MTENTKSTLEGLFKTVYGDKLVDLVCDETSLADEIPFVPANMQLGGYFKQPVLLTRSSGWTIAGSGGGAFALNASEPSITREASILGTAFMIRETIGYPEVSALLKNSGDARTKAFVSATSHLVEAMTTASKFVREISLLYGQASVGTWSSRTSGGGTGTQLMVLTTGTFIPAMWAGIENGYVDIYDSTGVTKRNAANAVQVTKVDVDTRTLTLVGNSTELDAITTGDLFYLRGCHANGMVGLTTIAANAGTLWGIAGATYSLFQGNSFAAGSAPLDFSKLMVALNKPINRGMRGQYLLYVSPKTWTDLNNDLSALRRYADKAGGKIEQGSSSIGYFSQAGYVEVKPHLYMMPSQALGYRKGSFKRIGTTDLTFSLPGSSQNFFTELADNAGYQMKAYWEQAPFTTEVKNCLLITGITNTGE